jgi:queuine tRNA-ribosyltransferase
VASAEAQLNDYRLLAISNLARRGAFTTGHGTLQMPAFMPVGTHAAVKAVSAEELERTGTRVLICNTYHLWLRPGAELIHEHGGLHEFMRWPHAIATDSGGFQAFSLAERTKLTEDGFEFASHLDGSRRLLTPEECMRVQGLLGADIILQLDVCPAAGVERAVVVDAVARTTRWAERCLAVKPAGQALFGIVQGGADVELRLQHAEQLSALPLDGLALGGFSVGEPPELMHRVLRDVVPQLDASRPRYLMGVGTPQDLVRAIGVGVDLFDCVLPSRNARNGQLFTRKGRLNIRNAKHRGDQAPIDEECACPACGGGYGRAYLRHLFVENEILAHRLLTLHNVHFYQWLLAEARRAIEEQRYDQWARGVLCDLADSQPQ